MFKVSDIRGQRRWLLHRDEGPYEMATTTEASAEEYKSEVSTMTTEASIEEAEDTTRLSEYLQRVKLYDDGGVGVFTGRPRS